MENGSFGSLPWRVVLSGLWFGEGFFQVFVLKSDASYSLPWGVVPSGLSLKERFFLIFALGSVFRVFALESGSFWYLIGELFVLVFALRVFLGLGL